MIPFKFSSLQENIYLLEFENNYDLAMHFLRAQEYYESPEARFRGKLFSLLDYIEWYSKNKGGNFTYATDWAGFNLPSNIIKELYVSSPTLPDENRYDIFMKRIAQHMEEQSKGKDYYLIGVEDGDQESIEHEVAHALWRLKEAYQTEQKKNLSLISEADYDMLSTSLTILGYGDDFVDDELQAYLSTATVDNLCEDIEGVDDMQKPFIKTFEEFRE